MNDMQPAAFPPQFVHASPKALLFLAFGSFGAVADLLGLYKTAPAKWTRGIPSEMIDRIATHPSCPPWLTREMLISGATVQVRESARMAA